MNSYFFKGRGDLNDICISDISVSRIHADI